jgi:ADP-ribose pyrophosphatase YjhB (NUDIX family)
VPPVRLRPSARAVILDDEDRILLCRFEFARGGREVVLWATPGGGVEAGESLLAALRRELREEVGLELDGEAPPHVWHQEAVRPGQFLGYDGAVNDFFLVRVPAFTPRGSMSDAELAAENVTGLRWWTPAEIAAYRGTDLFGPRNLGQLLAALLQDGPPAQPLELET